MEAQPHIPEVITRIIQNVKRVIVGKDRTVEHGVATLLAQGHLLIEDVPGVGKTVFARSLAVSTGCSFKRIQFTPDLLPSDVTGVSIYNQANGAFEFRPGPIMAQVVLADEINRATPKTQSALLEGMEERNVTIEGRSHALPRPFFVVATQNPVEYEGTFPLPEAQLDRFLMRVSLGYPSALEELSIIERQERAHPMETLKAVAAPQEVVEAQDATRQVFVDPLVRQYIVGLVEATRSHRDLMLGASPRASLALFRGSQSLALVRGRTYVIPDDVKELAEAVIAHRIVTAPAARMRGVDARSVVQQVLEDTAVPGAAARHR